MTDTTETSAFRIDVANLCVWRRKGAGVDKRLDLPPKTFDVLRYLVENAGRLISHDELLTALWGDVHVQPEVLKSHILAIRNALGDKSSSPRFIETQRGRGYRFIGRISSFVSTSEATEIPAEPGLLVGRAKPLRELQALLQRAIGGEPQAVFVSGEPGIGKTAFVQALVLQARHIAGLIVAQGHCIEGFAGREPYFPVLEALRQLCSGPTRAATVRILTEVAPGWAAQIAELRTEQRVPIDVARSGMVREGANLFEGLAAERPLLLILEDLHWADYATVDLLSALCRRRSATRLMLVATYRTEELSFSRHPLRQMAHDLAVRKYCQEIELGPLPEKAIAEILAGGPDGVPASEEFTKFVDERSGGNPLFIELILEFLQQRDMAERVGTRWRLLAPIDKPAFATPPTLGRILEAKMDGMPEEAHRVLEAASVMGLRFDAATAAPAAEMDAQSFEAICEELSKNTCTIRRGELVTLPDGNLAQTYTFRHALFRQVLYDRLGQARRARLHRAIGDRLEEIYPPDRRSDLAVPLAQHFAAAGDWPRALRYLRSALRVTSSRFAHRDTLAILDWASELVANLPYDLRSPAEIEFLERRAAVHALAHDPEATETYARLATRAAKLGDIDTQCRALIGLAYTASWHDLAHSLHFLDQVLVLCNKQSDPIRQDITRMTAYVRRLWQSGWNKTDARRCEEALARLEASGDRLTIARAQANFSMLCLVSTRYREVNDLVASSHRLLIESPQDCIEAELVRAGWMRNIGVPWSLFSLGEFGAALKDLDASIAAFEKNSDPAAASYLQVYRGALSFHAMNFEGVLRDCGPIAANPFEQDAGSVVLPVKRRIALIFCGLAEAALANNVVALGHFHAAEGEMERQPVHLDWYWRLPLEWGMINVLIAERNHPEALARAKHLCALVEQTDERAWQAFAWEARARAALSCGEASEAVDNAANALTACEGVTVPLAEWRVHATSAVVYQAANDTAQARRHTHLGETVRKRLAESLPEGHPLRRQFERRSASLFAV
jgi:DNA-binding winged helix-turn-helix (wHTH) protein/tetratricopeptide (TPR) repeat protein